MNRNEELIELKKELEQTPPELEYTAAKAIARAKKKRRSSYLWKTPAISFCSVIITFVLLVNLFPKVALAMSNVPILKDLVHAVAFDTGLKEAVEHDYYQVVGDSQTQGDVTVTVDYMIIDAGRISLFFSVAAPIKAGNYHFDIQDAETKRNLVAATMFDTGYEVGKLEEIKIEFTDENYSVPEKMNFNLTINQNSAYTDQMTVSVPADEDVPADNIKDDINSKGTDYQFSFLLQPELKYIQNVESIPLDQWITIKGQRIYLDRLNIYPTKTRLILDCDENNSAVLNELGVYFKDENGRIYDDKCEGITGTGSIDSYDIGSIYFKSSYFSGAKRLNMYITEIALIEKDRLYGTIDLPNQTISNLPEGVSVDKLGVSDHTLTIAVKAKACKPNYFNQLIGNYYDSDNNEYYFKSISGFTNEESQIYGSEYKIPDYDGKQYKIRWSYAPVQTLEEPIEIRIK